jgi:hypothetical protein
VPNCGYGKHQLLFCRSRCVCRRCLASVGTIAAAHAAQACRQGAAAAPRQIELEVLFLAPASAVAANCIRTYMHLALTACLWLCSMCSVPKSSNVKPLPLWKQATCCSCLPSTVGIMHTISAGHNNVA